MIKRLLYRPFFIRLFNWEYWPFHLVYGPVYLYWLFLCIRSRSFFFFNTSNPSIKNGGFLMESKKEIYDLLPSEYYPRTALFPNGHDADDIVSQIRQLGFRFPLIGKPDIGMKGLSVKKLIDEREVIEYARQSRVNFLLQEFIPYENEVGIFYYRFPDQQQGNISGIVSKEFLAVKGDGRASIMELLQADKRYVLQLPVLVKTYGKKLEQILAQDEEFLLVPYGNHVRGAKFLDASHLIDSELVRSIDSICTKVDGFYYGRMDVRYNTWEELRQGKNFSIIELNGAGSEPTHMYDPRHSIFFAWKEIVRHWNILWRISRMNHDKQHRPYMNTRSGLKMLRENKAYVKMIDIQPAT